jgi:putative endonuclease
MLEPAHSGGSLMAIGGIASLALRCPGAIKFVGYKLVRMRALIKRLLERRGTRSRAVHIELGERGEQAAIKYLKEYEGYEIVAANFRVPLGRGLRGQKLTAEIDIVAYDETTLVFVEVKTRTSNDLFAPEHAVDLRKRRQIARAARRYRQIMAVTDEPYRYDVVTVMPDGEKHRIELLRAYFDDGVFRRSRYFRT